MKRKSITLTICILAVLALASIGFASWIITNPSTSTQQDGTIEVDDVTSEVFKISATWDTPETGKINFGKPTNYTDKNTDWLKNGSESFQKLTADLTIAFQVEDNVNLDAILTETPILVSFKTLKNGAVMSEEDETNFYQGLTLPEPVLKIKSGENYVAFDGKIDPEDLDENNKCVIHIEFDWGTATNGKNPYVYYNGIQFGTMVGEDGNQKPIEVIAEEYLRQLYDAFQGIAYRIVLEEQTA